MIEGLVQAFVMYLLNDELFIHFPYSYFFQFKLF